MSETATRLPLAEAKAIADELVDLLSPSCQRIEVCGSIRRQAATCGDIDVVAISHRHPVTDMFGQEIDNEDTDELAALLDQLWRDQVVEKARRTDGAIAGWGPRLRKLVFQGLKVQVQSVDPECLGMWMVVRTGPATYSHAFVTPRGQKAAIRNGKGEVIAHREGMLPAGFTVEKGFRLHRAHLFVPTPDESSVYRALGWRYPEPWSRR